MCSFKIKDLPKCERPREKLIKYGAANLTNSELLAVIISTGAKGSNVLNLCNEIISKAGGINSLLDISFAELIGTTGIGCAKAAQLLAVVEISKRFKGYGSTDLVKITKPLDVASYLMENMRHLRKEVLKALMLNTKNYVIHIEDISIGSLNSSIVHPREVFTVALKYSSASIILCHNHPSGDPTPSGEDINITKRIKECGKLMGIELLDHVIIGNGNYISLKEKGIL